jgi:transposase
MITRNFTAKFKVIATIDDILKELEQLRLRVAYLEKEISLRDEKIKSLENRLNLNSTNSHVAPSKDPIQIKASKQRKKGGQKGGQNDHAGTTLFKSDFVDCVQRHIPKKCICGQTLQNVSSEVFDTRQVYDIELRHIITEHQRHKKVCPCCQHTNIGIYPTHVKSETQYGPAIKAFCTMLNVEYKVPYEKVAKVTNDLFGLPISKGTVCNFITKGSGYLKGFEDEIKQALLKSPVLHADETGIIVDVILHWMHVLSTDKYTYLRVHTKRGSQSFDDVIEKYRGNLIHDFFKSYFNLTLSKHNPCGAHITRELDSLVDYQSQWAVKFKELYYELLHQDHHHNQSNKQQIFQRYKTIIEEGKLEEPEPKRSGKRGRLKNSKGLNLILRLEQYMHQVLEFAFNPIIPFTNNQAERDLRHCKIKQKVSGCFRSVEGAHCYATIMSAISTLKKQSYDVFQSLITLFKYENLTLSPE